MDQKDNKLIKSDEIYIHQLLDIFIKCRKYKHQRPIDINHVNKLKENILSEYELWDVLIGEIILAKNINSKNTLWDILDGQHRFEVLRQFDKDHPIMNCKVKIRMYNLDEKQKRQLFRTINYGKPMCGMYYDNNYIEKVKELTISSLKKHYGNYIIIDNEKEYDHGHYWKSLTTKQIDELITKKNIEELGLTNLNGANFRDLIIELNQKMIDMFDKIFNNNDKWKSKSKYVDRIPDDDMVRLLDFIKECRFYKKLKSVYPLKITLREIVKMKKKNRDPFIIPLVIKDYQNLYYYICNFDDIDKDFTKKHYGGYETEEIQDETQDEIEDEINETNV